MRDVVIILVVAVLFGFAIRIFVFQSFFIPTGSMIPTLKVGNRVLVNELAYDFHPVHRGDIIVFKTPPNDSFNPAIKDLVKRVVGLPGDTITSINGRLYVNGSPLSEPYLPSGTVTSGVSSQKIPPGELWVMGDNRGDSEDSRYFGPISEKLIVGRVFLRYWPLSSFKVFG
ncbi:MAG: signal peptidase I [Actinomycetota bacterium]|nr:MAG: signal peptidase I [Actinomycetota bacterium]